MRRAGEVKYINACLVFRCAIYDTNQSEEKFNYSEAKIKISALQQYIKSLDAHLMAWKETVDTAREKYYELNYFTTLQLLQLRKELGALTHLSATHTVKPHVQMLLKSISPGVTSLVVTDSLQVAEQLELMDCEERVEAMPVFASFNESMITEDEVTEPANSPMFNEHIFQQAMTSTPAKLSTHQLTYDNLSEDQKKICTHCVVQLGLSQSHVLKAFEECKQNATIYDIEDWCEKNKDCSPQEENDSVGMADMKEEILCVYNPQEESDSDEDEQLGESEPMSIFQVSDCKLKTISILYTN